MSGAPDKMPDTSLYAAQPGGFHLPAPDDLIRLDPVDRQILEARILAERQRRKRRNIEAAATLPDVADWIESHFWEPTKVVGQRGLANAKKLVLEPFQRRILRQIFAINPATGRFPYRTVVLSMPKKSGKSTLGAAITAYFAANVEAPNAVYILANDREQSAGRIFKFVQPTLYDLNAKKDGKYGLFLPNGTEVRAITSDPDKEAGASYGLTVWDELWAFTSARSRLLFDEMMPVLTRNISMRLIVTYAGFEDSSDLLLQLYTSIFKDTSETELQDGAQPVVGLEDIVTTNAKGEVIPACYELPKAGLFYLNDHEQRMPWQRGEQAESFKDETFSLLTAENQFRLMENRWQLTESRLLNPDKLALSFVKPVSQARPMVFAADAGWKHDSSGLVGTYEEELRYKAGYAKAWVPKSKDDPLDLDVTIGDEIMRLWRAGLILRREAQPFEKKLVDAEQLTPIEVWYDPTQMHQVAMRIRKKFKLLCAEFHQGKERLLADSFLLQQYNEDNIDNLPSQDLQSHLEAARAENQTSANQALIRIVKGTGTHAKPIDLAVCESMAVYRVSKRPRKFQVGGIAQGVSNKGWSKK